MRIDEERAAATEETGHLGAVGVVKSNRPTGADCGGALDAHALSGCAGKRQLRILTRNRGCHSRRWSTWRDRPGDVDNVVKRQRHVAGSGAGGIDENCVSAVHRQRLRIDETAASVGAT